MINIRLGMHHSKLEKSVEFIEAVKRHPGCCDEVWFASEYGFPKLERHKAIAESIAELSKLYKDAGIKVSLQISNTIGHGEYMKEKDCTGLVYEGSNVEKMVDANGTVADYAFCWRGKNFIDYTIKEMEYYSIVKPDTFWVDDDLRAYNHAPVDYGCFCDDCINTFNKEYGYSFTREELAHEISYGDIMVREDYIKFIRDGIEEFTGLITKALMKHSPDSIMGYQSCRCNNYTGIDYNYYFDPMYKYSGKPPKYRPGGGYYNDKTPFGMFEKAMLLEAGIAQIPDYVTDILPEVENTPDVAFGKSIWGTVTEASLYLAYGCTATSFASLMTEYEDISWHENMFDAFVKVKPYWLKLAETSKSSTTCGVSIYESENSYKQKLNDGDSKYKWARIYHTSGMDLSKIGVPVTNMLKDVRAYIITSAMVDYMDREELLALTKVPVVLDTMAAQKIIDKGIDLGITLTKLGAGSYLERLNTIGNKKWSESFFTSRGFPTYVIDGQNIKPIGTLYQKHTEEKIGCCNAIVDLKEAKWAVFGYSFWNDILSTDKRNQILYAIDEIAGNNLPAYLKSGEQVAVIPKVNNDGKTLAVSLQNISIGKTQELTVIIRNPVSENFYYMNGETPRIKVNAIREGKDYTIKLPSLNGWELGTVFCE